MSGFALKKCLLTGALLAGLSFGIGTAIPVCAENNTDVLHQGFEHVPTAETLDF